MAPTINLDPLGDATWLDALLRDRGPRPEHIATLAGAMAPGQLQNFGVGLSKGAIPGFGGDVALLARLFVLGLPVSRDALRALVGEPRLEQLLGSRLVEACDDDWSRQWGVGEKPPLVRAPVAVSRIDGVACVSDHYASDAHPRMTPEHVLGVGNGTTLAANLTVRRRVADALDIGVGQGFQSLSMAAHATRVVATDINPRAMEFARASSRISGKSNIEFRMGSFLEPLADGEMFDLIVSNPPFIITRKGGLKGITTEMGGDDAVRMLASELPKRLRPGGWMTMLLSWHHGADKDWSTRPRSWIAGLECESWLMRFESTEAASYARQFAGMESGEAFDERAWDEYCRENGIAAIGYGALIVHRRASGSGWVRIDDVATNSIRGASGQRIEAAFSCWRMLRSLPSAEALLDVRVRAAVGTRSFDLPPAAKAPPHVVQLQHSTGIALPMLMGRDVVESLQRFDGSRTIGESLRSIFPAGTPEERIRTLGLPIVRSLVERAYLVPEPGDRG